MDFVSCKLKLIVTLIYLQYVWLPITSTCIAKREDNKSIFDSTTFTDTVKQPIWLSSTQADRSILTCSIRGWSCHHTLSNCRIPYWRSVLACWVWLGVVTEAHCIPLSISHGMGSLYQVTTWYSYERWAVCHSWWSHHVIRLLLNLWWWGQVWNAHGCMHGHVLIRNWF